MKKKIGCVSCDNEGSRLFSIVESLLSFCKEEISLTNNLMDEGPFDAVICQEKSLEQFAVRFSLYSSVHFFENLVLVYDSGIFPGEKGTRRGKRGREAYEEDCYAELDIERLCRLTAEYAERFNISILSVDNADVSKVGQLWRYVVHDVMSDYPDIRLEDTCFWQFVAGMEKAIECPKIVLTNRYCGGIISKVLRAKAPGEYGFSCLKGDTSFSVYLASDDADRKKVGYMLSEMMKESFDRPDLAMAILERAR